MIVYTKNNEIIHLKNVAIKVIVVTLHFISILHIFKISSADIMAKIVFKRVSQVKIQALD